MPRSILILNNDLALLSYGVRMAVPGGLGALFGEPQDQEMTRTMTLTASTEPHGGPCTAQRDYPRCLARMSNCLDYWKP